MKHRTLHFVGGQVRAVWIEINAPRIDQADRFRFGQPDPFLDELRRLQEEMDRDSERMFRRSPPFLAPAPPPVDDRRAKVQRLVDRGATEGERAAARAALERLDSK